jgi:hypothetical protein
MAEFWAFRVLEELGGNSWVRPMLRCARARLASIAAHPEERSEDRWLGRDVLAIHSLWRRDRETFDVLLRATVDRARNGETRPDVVWGALTPIHPALRRWAESSSLPQPRLERGQLFDASRSGLPTMVNLSLPSGACSEVWLDDPVPVPTGAKISPQQWSPVLAAYPFDANVSGTSSSTGYAPAFAREGFHTIARHIPARPIMRHDLKGAAATPPNKRMKLTARPVANCATDSRQRRPRRSICADR